MADRPTGADGASAAARLLERLRERKLFQWGIAYLAAAWVALQGTAILADQFGWPGWVQRSITVLLAVGLVAALVLAWYHGEQGRQRVSRVEAAILVTLLVIAGGVLTLVRGDRGATSGASGAPEGPAAATTALEGTDASELAVSSPLDGRPSVAVLPFANLGGGEESAAFALGVHDDVLGQLARIDALRVISRTSVMGYAETSKNVREIARELGVTNVLEGGLQRAGDRVRLNVQLIDAATDAHLWAERYDRELTAENVFAIQAEIARAVAAALAAELSPEEESELARAPTESLAALDYYHRGVTYQRRFGVREIDSLAAAMFERAVEEDPAYVEAWSRLTRARSWQVRSGYTADTEPARRAMERTRSLAPESVEADLAAGFFHYYALGDYRRALEAFTRAEARLPGDASVLSALGFIHRRLGDWERALSHEERVLRVDPRNPQALLQPSFTLVALERLDEAAQAADRAVLADPSWELARAQKLNLTLWDLGDRASALDLAEASRDVFHRELWAWWQTQIALAGRDYRSAIDHARGLPPIDQAVANRGFTIAEFASPPPRELVLARAHRLAGDDRSATEQADRALAFLATVDADTVPELFGQRAAVHLYRGRAHAARGDRGRAVREADRAGESFGPEDDALEGPWVTFYMARIFAEVGAHDRAVDALEALLAGPGGEVTRARLRHDPSFDVLRDEPRFRSLVEPDAP